MEKVTERAMSTALFRKGKLRFFTIYTRSEFHQTVLKYVSAIKFIYLTEKYLLKKPENMDQDVKQIVETL